MAQPRRRRSCRCRFVGGGCLNVTPASEIQAVCACGPGCGHSRRQRAGLSLSSRAQSGSHGFARVLLARQWAEVQSLGLGDGRPRVYRLPIGRLCAAEESHGRVRVGGLTRGARGGDPAASSHVGAAPSSRPGRVQAVPLAQCTTVASAQPGGRGAEPGGKLRQVGFPCPSRTSLFVFLFLLFFFVF